MDINCCYINIYLHIYHTNALMVMIGKYIKSKWNFKTSLTVMPLDIICNLLIEVMKFHAQSIPNVSFGIIRAI